MASSLRLAAPGQAWVALAASLAAAAVMAGALPAVALDWQPALAAGQPWRAWTAAFVHWSPLHLAANLGATAVVAVFGHFARVPWPLAAAWFAAWPLTQWGLLLRPELAHYGGLSGVLHAGVVVAALGLLQQGGRRRLLAVSVLAGVGLKLLLESPWGPVLRQGDGWDIAIAPLAHATGAVAGLACATIALLWQRRARPAAATAAKRGNG